MLKKALADLIRQETEDIFSFEIVVVDDGSSDESRKTVEQISATSPVLIRYIKEEGHGYTHTMNRGIKESRGDWIAFFDDDESCQSSWLKELMTVALKTGAKCLGGPCMLDLPKEKLSSLGPVCRAVLGEHTWYSEIQRCFSKYLPGGGNMIINREVFKSIGRFDENILTGGCDRDLIIRTRSAGFDIWYVPKAMVWHRIPFYRLNPAYILWNSLQVGASFAFIDWKKLGPVKTTLLCVARIGQALLINLPMLIWAHLKINQPEILDRKALLFRAMGYVRKTFFLISPSLFAQEKFFSRLEFRKERNNFSK